MARALILALMAVLLVGCVSPEEQEARDRESCIKQSGDVESDAYTDCRLQLNARRAAAERAQLEWNIGNYRQNVGR